MMQIVKELLETEAKQKLQYREADNIKFLAVIEPGVNAAVKAAIDFEKLENQWTVNASLYAGETTFFKIKALLLGK